MILKLKQTPGIYLVGFMGTGKSTLGRLLADKIGWPFVDLDADIETTHGITVMEMFATLGESGFRKLETEALAKHVRAAKNGRPLVIALGGGAYVQPGNPELVATGGIAIWLDAPLDVVERRVAGGRERPLTAHPARFRELYQIRREIYAKADYTVPIVTDDPHETLDQILALPAFA
jgi:shikimate kinase